MNTISRTLLPVLTTYVLLLGVLVNACGAPLKPVAETATHACAGTVEIHDAAGLRAAAACRTIAGDLLIASSSLTSLAGLEGLTSVRYLVVAGNRDLASLEGLRGLRSAAGVTVSGNPSLTSLAGLGGLASVEGLVVTDNGVATLAGLEGLRAAGDVVIASNPALTTLAGLESLASIEGELDVERNASLPDAEAVRLQTRLVSADEA